MPDWSALTTELSAWRDLGRPVTLWWRDDDVQRATPALAKLLDLSRRYRVPLLLAAVPHGMDRTLVSPIAQARSAWVCQHGFAHANHAPADEKRSELGPHRPVPVMARELIRGLDILRERLGERMLPVMVPPWNRISDHLIKHLPHLGYRGLSTFGARLRDRPTTGLTQVNTHVDLIDWRGGRGFVGAEAALSQLVNHLSARRQGQADVGEPTGLMSHHLVHDDRSWAFCETLFERTCAHPGVRWLEPDQVFTRDDRSA